jgi:hypothetical protein
MTYLFNPYFCVNTLEKTKVRIIFYIPSYMSESNQVSGQRRRSQPEDRVCDHLLSGQVTSSSDDGRMINGGNPNQFDEKLFKETYVY